MTRTQLKTKLYKTFVREYPDGDDSFMMPCWLARGVNLHGVKCDEHEVFVTFETRELHIDIYAPGNREPVFALKLALHAQFVATHTGWREMAHGIAQMISDNLSKYIW